MRWHLKEIHDDPRFPGSLRDMVTEALQSLWDFAGAYRPIFPLLWECIDRAGSREVLDLCSGGGGPWLRFCREIESRPDRRLVVRLTDKYPHRSAYGGGSQLSGILHFEPRPIDAECVPEELQGFRTIFSSFHHFEPGPARRVLRDAMTSGHGIGIFELARRGARTMLACVFSSALVLLLAPSIRPFLWTRLLWTYLVPVIPFVVMYDGLVSCLRSYSLSDLEELVRPLRNNGAEWRIGVEDSGLVPVTYLIGVPLQRQGERKA